MHQKLLTENRFLYFSTDEHPKVIKIKIRMRDMISPSALANAVANTMKRYPYFCVELKKIDSDYYYIDNERPVAIANTRDGIDLNAPASNYHMLAFSWYDNWIVLDIFHGLTDGTGAYEIIRTLLYYYCSERYQVQLKEEGIRLLGDIISAQEWEDPVALTQDLPKPGKGSLSTALNLIREGKLEQDTTSVVYSVAVSEKEFMHFNLDNDGSPGTMAALFLSRAIAKLHPACPDPIRIILCVNERNALQAPLAHQSLVGGVRLEYKEIMKKWPLEKQATAFRGMVMAQSREEAVLVAVANQKNFAQMLLEKPTDEERLQLAQASAEVMTRVQTATVSYVGKANYKEAESYIRDFRLWACAEVPILMEISAVNGRFTFDFIQQFSSPMYVNAFLEELEENGILYDLQDVMPLTLSGLHLPW